jgi:hypothetical protein
MVSTWHTAGLALVVYGCSILDALLTLLYVQDGGGEAPGSNEMDPVESKYSNVP